MAAEHVRKAIEKVRDREKNSVKIDVIFGKQFRIKEKNK